MRLTVMIAATIALASAIAPDAGDQCGIFSSPCAPFGPDSREVGYVISGVSTGTFDYDATGYDGNDCKTKVLSISIGGMWVDLGVNDGVKNSRGWQLSYTTIDVTPMVDSQTKELQTSCPCGGTWKTNITRSLSQCDPDECKDTSWLGSDPNDAVIIGQAFYGWTILDATPPGNFSVSPFSSDYDKIKNKDFVYAELPPTAEGGCDAVDYSDAICGVWDQVCMPTFRQDAASKMNHFEYQGPLLNFTKGMSGTYMSKQAFYQDAACQISYIELIEEGTFTISDDKDLVEDEAFAVEKVAGSITVTPRTKAAVTDLKANCACGNSGLWALNEERILTTCTSCDAWWYDGESIGSELFGIALRSDRNDDLAPELRLSAFVNDSSAANNLTLSGSDYPYTREGDTCEFPGKPDYGTCGVWFSGCVADEGFVDTKTSLEFVGNLGSGVGNGTGLINMALFNYKPGTACSDDSLQFEVVQTAYYSDYGDYNLKLPNARKVLIKSFSTEVIPYSSEWTADLNLQCPCGGTWKTGVSRILSQCPNNTCTDPKGLGLWFGNPGYAGVLIDGNQLRMTDVGVDQDFWGVLSNFNPEIFPMMYSDTCTPSKPSQNIEGGWFQPCHKSAQDNFESSATINIDGDDFVSERKLYAADFIGDHGCFDDKRLAITVKVSGSIGTGQAAQATSAYQVQFKNDYFDVTPHDAKGLNLLKTQCACGQKWAVGVTVRLSGSCPAGTCDSDQWLRQNIGSHSYGAVFRSEDTLRFTQLGATTDSYNELFTDADKNWLTYGDAPGPNPSHGKHHHKKTDGGGIFLLVLFLVTLSYFVAGMALNYKKTGSPTIPHASFWTALPGLVSDGIYFSFCTCFGSRGGRTYETISSTNQNYGSV